MIFLKNKTAKARMAELEHENSYLKGEVRYLHDRLTQAHILVDQLTHMNDTYRQKLFEATIEKFRAAS